MDTIGNEMRIDGARVSHDYNAITVKLLATNKTFRALLSQEIAVDPGSMLGSDLREQLRMSVVRNDLDALGLLGKGVASQIPVLIQGARHNITRREDNAASPFVDFDVVKV
jgi:hypothetical protein